jgi:hypothetical protein
MEGMTLSSRSSLVEGGKPVEVSEEVAGYLRRNPLDRDEIGVLRRFAVEICRIAISLS